MVILETERLALRHLRINDKESMYRIFCDPEVMRFGDSIQTKEWVHNWLGKIVVNYYETWGFGPYAVVERTSQKVIGYCGLFFLPDINGQPEIEIGYRLARSQWGYGYATEAAQTVRDFAFGSLNIKRLIAMIDPQNIASIHVAEKLGMTHEQDVMFEGYTHPDHIYVITSKLGLYYA